MTAPLSASRTGRRYVACWIAFGAAVLAGGLLFGLRGSSPKIIELSFEPPASGGNADEQTLRSIRKVGNLYLVTSHGDYETRLEWLDDYHRKKSAELAAVGPADTAVSPLKIRANPVTLLTVATL